MDLRADPVTLSAGQPSAVRVAFSYSASNDTVLRSRPAVALLFWEGPGVTRQVVPADAVSTPDGSAQGWLGHYVVESPDQPVDVTRVDRQLNFIWYHGSQVIPRHAALREALADRLFAVAASPENLAVWEENRQAQQNTWLGAQWTFLESLDGARQRQWVERLLAHPVLLEDCSRLAMHTLYAKCRIGAPRRPCAGRVLGAGARR